MRLTTVLLFAALVAPAKAQIATPVPCVLVGSNGRTEPPGFFFLSLMEGRVVTMIVRSRQQTTEVTDFSPLPGRSGTSFFHDNIEVRALDRPRSQFMLATVVDSRTILMEMWDKTNPQPSVLSSFTLRCTP